uniref:CARDB protein n=1 Tax=Candidatus Kentrum sp. LFY TaxID=2126342 RepID=A0A450VAF2_9GAMM|nr:MAG: CARDB protein [Candidatus Kentron sp. LFY]
MDLNFDFDYDWGLPPPPATSPDLAFTNGSMTGSFRNGGRVTAKVWVKNNGSANAGGFHTGYYLSTDAWFTTSDRYLAVDHTHRLDRGRTAYETASFNLNNLTYGRTYYLGAIVDNRRQINERNEFNNTRLLKSFRVVGDLSITSGSFDWGSFGPNQTSMAKVGVKNSNESIPTAFSTRFYLSTDSTITTSDTYLSTARDFGGLGSNRTEYRWASLRMPTSLVNGQTYHIGAIVDYDNRVAELSENNNTRVLKTFTARADLSISQGSVTGVLGAGESVTASVTLKNTGASTGVGFSTRYYLSTDSTITTGDTYLGASSSGSLGYNGTEDKSATFLLPEDLDGGKTYHLGAIVDYDNKVAGESNEGNNTKLLATFVPEKAVSTDVFEGNKDFNLAGKQWTFMSPFKTTRVEKNFSEGLQKNGKVGKLKLGVEGSAWADLTAGLDLGFNLGSIAGQSNLDTDLEMVVPAAIKAGEHFTIDTSKWSYDVANGAGFELDDSNWGFNADMVVSGSAGIAVEAEAVARLKRVGKIKPHGGATLQFNPAIELDLLAVGGIEMGDWELSTTSHSLTLTKGDAAASSNSNSNSNSDSDKKRPENSLSLNAPQLEGVESERNGSSFKAERDAGDNLVNGNIDLVNVLAEMTKSFPVLSALNYEKELFNESRFGGKVKAKADLEAKLLSLGLDVGLGYGETIKMDYDPTKMDLTLAFGDQTRTGKLGDSFSFLAPDDESATNLQVDFGYDGKIQAERNLNLNGGVILGVGIAEVTAKLKVKGVGEWGPSFSPAPLVEMDMGVDLAANVGSIGNHSKSLNFTDTANIAMAYA